MRTPRLALGFDRFFLLGFFFLFLGFEFVADELEDGYLGVVSNTIAGMDDAGIAAGAVGKLRRDCSESRLPSVIIFSATGRAAFARVNVVVMRPCSNRLVTRLRNTARR